MEHVLCSVLFFVNRKKEKREKDLVTRRKVETGYKNMWENQSNVGKRRLIS